MREENLRDRQRAFRAREIAMAAARLLAKSDCRSLTMDQVAAALGTSKASIYRIFPREELLHRAVEESIRDALTEAREAAERVVPQESLRAAARSLIDRWLRLAPHPNGLTAPCCLQEVECPYTDWAEADRLLHELAGHAGNSPGTLPLENMGLARALRALTAVTMHRLRAEKRRPTPGDVDTILRYLLPDPADRDPSRRPRRG